MSEPFRVAMVPGVSPGKWIGAWRERRPRSPIEIVHVDETEQRAVLDEGRADVVLARLPFERDGAHLIRLYSERPVVVVSTEHPIALFESVTLADLEGETERTEAAADAIELAAAGAGIVRLPHSIARANSRKDVAIVPISDAEETEVGIAWLADQPDAGRAERIDFFIGIVRGRRATSSRGGRSA